MSNYANLKTAINTLNWNNGNNEITGPDVRDCLLALINSLGAGYQFVGVADVSTNPGTPDQNVFYIAGPGTYPNFSGAVVNDGYLGVFKYNGTWTIESVKVGDANSVKYVAQTLTDAQKGQARTNIGAASTEELNQLGQEIYNITASSRATNCILKNNGNTEYNAASNAVVDTFPVIAGMSYLVSGRVGNVSGSCLVCFYDEAGTFIAGSSFYPSTGTPTPYTESPVTAPDNAATMKVSGNILEGYPNPPAARFANGLELANRVMTLEGQAENLFYQSTNKFFVGKGATYNGVRVIGLARGRKYRFVYFNPNYDKTGVPAYTTYALLQISSANANNVVSDLVYVNTTQTLSQTYEFTVPDDSVRIGVGGRAAIGERVYFNIYDITDETELKQDVNIAGNLKQGNASNKGVISVDAYYNKRSSCVMYLGEFSASGAKLIASVDKGKIIRNAALYNSLTDQTTGWLYPSGNSANTIDFSFPSGSETYDTLILTVAYADLTTEIVPADVTGLFVGGYFASLVAINGTRENVFRGKNYSVMGDSIGTNNDGDTPAFTITANDVGHEITSWITWYDFNNSREDTPSGTTKTIGGVTITSAMVGTQQTFTPTNADIGKTLGTPRWAFNEQFPAKPWWKILGEKLGMSLNSSASWNGNSYCSHEESDNLRKIGYGWHPLQIQRLANRDADGNRVAPDYIFLCRGTNDATHSPYAKITDFGNGIDTIPADDTVTGGYGFKEALAKTIALIQTTYPKAKIFVSTLSPFRRLNDDTFPMDNGTNTMQDYNKAVKQVAEYMGVKVIDFSKCWTFYNCVSEGYVRSADYTHPVQKGHDAMAEQALKDVLK